MVLLVYMPLAVSPWITSTVCGARSRNSMNVMSPMFVTVTTPPRNGVGNEPGGFPAAACTTDIFQNGLLVWISMVMRLVLLVAVKVNGRPLGEQAVTGRISVLPAGMLALGIGSITGAAKAENTKAPKNKTARRIRRRFMI